MRGILVGILALVMLLPAATRAQTPVGQDPRLVEGPVGCPRLALAFTIEHGHSLPQEILRTLIEQDVPSTVLPVDLDGRNQPDGPLRSVDVYNAAFHGAYPGAIVEIHLADPDAERATALALPRLVDDLRARGFEFVTIEALREPCEAPGAFTPETITLAGLNVHGLHCKAAPSRQAALIRILFNGDMVTSRGPGFDGWLPVECAGQDGWVKASALP